MLRFRIALIAYSMRLILPLAGVVLGIGGAFVLGFFPLGGAGLTDNCFSRAYSTAIYCFGSSETPFFFGWQGPVAVLIGAGGLASAFVIAVWNHRHPPTRPLPPLPGGWQ
jgi:hypothetical protein